MAKLYSIKALRPLLPLEQTVAPLSYFFYPMGGGTDSGWMFRYVVDSKGLWFQKNDHYMSPNENGFDNRDIAAVSGLDLDELEIVPFESNALHHSEVQLHPFRYGLPGGKPILPLPFTARQFFDWEKQCLRDELLSPTTKTFFRHRFIFDDELAELDEKNPDAAELARICLAGVAPDEPNESEMSCPAPVVAETKEQRQDRRLKACIDARLPMDSKAALLRLPYGVGKVAKHEGVSRQAFSADVNAALIRRASAIREGGTIYSA